MLKNNILLAISVLLAVTFSGNRYEAFAENNVSSVASNDDPGASKVSPEAAENADKDSEVGVSGSYLSSQFARSNGDIESAIKSLKLVYDKDPKDTEVANQLMGLYLLGGHMDKAMIVAINVYKNNDKDPISCLMLSLKAIKNNNAAAASQILNKLSEEEGGQLWLPLISAWLDVEQHQMKNPLIMEELSAEVGRAAPIVSYHLALINASAGFTRAAIDDFKYAVEDKPNPPARVMYRLLNFYDKNNSPEELKPIVTKYRESMKNSRPVNLENVDNMKSGAAEVLLTMGSLMLASGVTQDATLYLQLALYLKPDMDVAIITLAQAYSELQQYGIANELLAKIAQDSLLYNDAQLFIAINLGHLNKIAEADAKLDSIIEKFPNSLDAYMAKGDLLRTREHYADAISVYETALAMLKEKKPQHWPIYFAVGICQDKMGNWTEAEKSLRRSIELSPNQPDVLNYLGYSLLTRGENFAEARRLIEKAIAKRPSDPQIMDSMGLALYMAGDYEQAEMYLERAVSLLPADVTINEHLGDIYWRMGRKNEARFQWDRSLTYSKEAAISQEITEKIKNGLPEKSAADADKNQTSVVEKKDKDVPVSNTVTE